jgi:high affinity cGMP-specific 3',5'-cyclic phosphodiesterase 9
MDKLILDGSIYHQVPQQTQYVEKYQFSETIKEALKTATFNNWEYEDNELVSLVIHMYVELRIPEHFKIELQTLHNFVTRVRENYNNNPFHCFKHGFCVFQMAYALIHATGFVNEISMLEKLILLTACIGHDLDHPGYNNAYQINGNHSIF